MKRKRQSLVTITSILKTNSTKKYFISHLSILFSFSSLQQIIIKGHELGSSPIAGDIIITKKNKKIRPWVV